MDNLDNTVTGKSIMDGGAPPADVAEPIHDLLARVDTEGVDGDVHDPVAQTIAEDIWRRAYAAGAAQTVTAVRARLGEHFLAQVVCDHENGVDNPVCACSRVFLGWHPSVGEAVSAWIGHLFEAPLPMAGR